MRGGQQPAHYKAVFRQVADAIRRIAPGSAMMWAPNYAGGYPFFGGQFGAQPGTEAFRELDTDRDGALTTNDDPYGPYYPGDQYVDWVGISLYHWGNHHLWETTTSPSPTSSAKCSPALTAAPQVTSFKFPTSTMYMARNTTTR
jgi:hypothetical protein